MKKEELRALLAQSTRERAEAMWQAQEFAGQVRRLAAELDTIKTNWRPVPITHEWQPRNPQCALCDDPRDSPRHRSAPLPEVDS